MSERSFVVFFVLAGNFYNFFTGARPLDRAMVFGVWRVVRGVQDAFLRFSRLEVCVLARMIGRAGEMLEYRLWRQRWRHLLGVCRAGEGFETFVPHGFGVVGLGFLIM